MEIEAKFVVPDNKTFGRLQEVEHLAGYRLSETRTKKVRDDYLDTTERQLLAAGYAFRRREQAGGMKMTLKALGVVEGAVHRREELEIDLSTDHPPQVWPDSPVRDRVLEIIGNRLLHILFSLKQTRSVRQVSQNERVVAKLSLDDVYLAANGHEEFGLELEVEQTSQGTESDLAALATCLRLEWQLQPQPRSKFERAMAFVDRCSAATQAVSKPKNTRLPPQSELPGKAGLEANDSMAEAAQKTLWFHFQLMLHHEPGTRLGENIEALHDMRVATRRMRAAYQIFAGYLEPAVVVPYVKGLRRTGRALGEVRDLDVFWEKTQRYLDILSTGEQTALEPLKTIWIKAREKARKRMLKYLNSKRYRRFKDNFARFLQEPGCGALPTTNEEGFPLPHYVKDVIPIVLYQHLAVVQAYDEFVTLPDVPVEHLHRLRIACKGLRYSLEFFREVLGPVTQELIKQIKILQNHLGDLQDAVIARRMLQNYLTWGTWDRKQIKKIPTPHPPLIDPGANAYLANREAECQTLLDTFPEVWAEFKNSQFKSRLATLIGKL